MSHVHITLHIMLSIASVEGALGCVMVSDHDTPSYTPSYTSVCHVYIYWTYVTFRKNLLEIKSWATVLYLVSNITSKLVNFHTRISFRYHICLPSQVGEPFCTSQ